MAADAVNTSPHPHAVLVLGSLHYDIMVESQRRPLKGETVTGTRWYPKFGGKGGNQAVAAKFHGAETQLISATGTDAFADYLHARLAQASISSEFVARLNDEATGMSVAIQDAEGDYSAVIISGANLAISANVMDNPAIWDNAAVLLLQNEVPESLNMIAARKAHELGLTVCLNAAPAREMSPQFMALVDILIVNTVEAEALGSDTVDSLGAAALAASTLSDRFSTVIVTAGADGVAACSADGSVVEIAAKPIDVVSTHGAGDVFSGVLCAELAHDTPLNSAISIANDAAGDHVAGL